jgi:hypothetical protein
MIRRWARLATQPGYRCPYPTHKQPGIYRTPSYSPDGATGSYTAKMVVISTRAMCIASNLAFTLSTTGGEPTFVTAQGEYPVFDKTGQIIFYQPAVLYLAALQNLTTVSNPTERMTKSCLMGNMRSALSQALTTNGLPGQNCIKSISRQCLPSANPLASVPIQKLCPLPRSLAMPASISIGQKIAKSSSGHWENQYFSDELTERFSFLEGARDSLPPMDTLGLADRSGS